MFTRLINSLRQRMRTPATGATAAPAVIQPSVDFRVLMEGSLDMICHVQVAQGAIRFTYSSPATPDIVGWTCEEFLTLTPHQIFTEESMSIIAQDIKLISGENKTSTVVVEAFHKDGRRIWLENKVCVLERGANGTMSVVVSMRDVTERRTLQERLAGQALTDDLTGINNRRCFDQAIDLEWRRMLRTGLPLSLLLLDIDHFKSVNDTYGHQIGDDCLRVVASAIHETVRRPGDSVARYGGEEFAVLLPATDLGGAEIVAQEIRLAIVRLQIPNVLNVEGGGFVTVSCGASTALVRAGGTSEMLQALLLSADTALYRAKSEGRNRVAVSPLLATNAFLEPQPQL